MTIESERAAGRTTVLERVKDRFETMADAERWYENIPIPGFGSKTAKDLVDEGHADWVVQAIDAIEAGVYA